MIIPEAGTFEAVEVALFREECLVGWGGFCAFAGRLRVCWLIWLIVLAMEDDGPAGREHIVVRVQIVCAEVETAKDRRDAQCLPIGEVDRGWWHVFFITCLSKE